MSYPFGSGMPPLPNANSGSSYPQMPSEPFGTGAGYPPIHQTTQFQHSNPTPGYPIHSQYPAAGGPPFGGGGNYPPMPQTGGYPQMPQTGGYPQMPQTGGYPQMPQTGGYPQMPQTGGYPQHQVPQASAAAYLPPSQMPSYPSETNNSYNSSQGYSGNAGFQQTSSSSGPSFGYPSMVNVFNDMQGHIKDTRKSKGNPTVVAVPNFDPTADANALRKAMKGFGTDENALIEVLCRRSNEQRLMIQRSYKTLFGKDLVEDIRSETTGNFENLLVALLTPIIDFYVKELHDAMAGLGTDEDVLIEVLCSMSNYEIHTIKNSYVRLYGQNLESELMSETSGNFKRLLVALCTANRDESGVVDPEAAKRDATELLRAGELRAGTDESTFNMVFCQRSYPQIKLICEEYKRLTGHGLEKAIHNEFSGDIMDGLIAILQCTTNKAEFFASRFHKSMAGIGTNDKQLIRLIVTRCEVDLNDIKVAFERLYGKSLRSWIKGDTSGHYKHALYALIGEQRSS